ncbi:DUF413 domain-containing protein [Allomuricauda sp.]|uniref:Macrodomain Ori protein n=2 Tax=unclassified Flagellimonas TaxID=2644544 RepID=A0AAU7N0U6_9FLAO|nr:DUF413 domain-containing protein [Allomuricauda sp.]
MNTVKDHMAFRKLKIECSFMRPVLTPEEYEILNEFGAWMNALYDGTLTPLTKKQEEFCQNLDTDAPPTEKYARIFWLYLKRKELFKQNKLSNQKKLMKDDREDWKKIRKMRFLICSLMVLGFTWVSAQGKSLSHQLWERVKDCQALLDDTDNGEKLDFNKIDDSKNGYLKIWGSYPTCGCTCSSTVGAYRDIHGGYTFLQKEESSCDWRKSISSNKDLAVILPDSFDIRVFSKSQALIKPKYALFFLDVEIPRFGTDTKFTLKLIPFGILKPEENSLITYNYSEYNIGKEKNAIAPKFIQNLKHIVAKINDGKTLMHLLNKNYDSINPNDKKYIEQNVLGKASSNRIKSLDELTETLILLKNAYDVYSELDFMSVMMKWNKEKGRFEIKSKGDLPKPVSFKEFILENEFWVPVC